LKFFVSGKNQHCKVSFPLVIGLTALVLWLGLRFVLMLDISVTKMHLTQTLAAFSWGAWFDVSTLAYLISPWLIISAITPQSWRSRRWMHNSRWVLTWLVTAALFFGIVAEYIFWQEFTTRFNFIAVDYLIYTNEVIGNIRESYPVPLMLAIIALAASLVVWGLSRIVSFDDQPRSLRHRAALVAVALLLPGVSLMAANVDQMQQTTNAYANELAGNGLFSLAAAMHRNELDYDKFYRTMPQEQADATLRALNIERLPLSQAITKQVVTKQEVANLPASEAMGGFSRRPKNIILITVESLSAEYLGSYGGQENLTPYLDKIAAQGLKFEHVFATGTRTVRGLDALSLGIPPIPGQAIIHRPDNEHLATIGEFLEAQNFKTFFIYGGYGYFDNMNAYFKANDYNVVDRTDFDSKEIAAENVWGVADESLFNHTLKTLDQVHGQPFFAQVMTTSNHRPFTFPEGRIDLPQGHRPGAVKYTDYAIGKFIEDAKSKPWFKDTLFVIVADHCASVAGKTRLPVAKYHIPLIFYAPDMLKPGSYQRMASQIDIPPTLLDLLGAEGDKHFFGESLFKFEKQPARAFISNYQELGYYKDDQLIVLSPKRKTEAFKVDPVTLESEPTTIDPALLKEAIAYYQTAARSFKVGALKEHADSNMDWNKKYASLYLQKNAKL